MKRSSRGFSAGSRRKPKRKAFSGIDPFADGDAFAGAARKELIERGAQGLVVGDDVRIGGRTYRLVNTDDRQGVLVFRSRGGTRADKLAGRRDFRVNLGRHAIETYGTGTNEDRCVLVGGRGE